MLDMLVSLFAKVVLQHQIRIPTWQKSTLFCADEDGKEHQSASGV